MKVRQKIHRCKETVGKVCSDCNHAMSNHTVIIDTKDETYSKITCNLCKCTDGSF